MNSQATLTIPLTGKITLAKVERVLAERLQESRRAPGVLFDVTALDWIGHFPAAMLFAWAATLRQKNSEMAIAFRAPEISDLTPQVRKALVLRRTLEFG